MPRIIRKGERTPLTGPDDSRHGTNTTYVYWLCRCDRCRAAHAAYNTDLKRRLAAAPTPERVHGTVNGYSNHGCRCEPCTTAQRVTRQARDARRAAASVELLTPASHTPNTPDQAQTVSRCDLGFEHIVER